MWRRRFALLAIRFVRAEQGKISGTIASYWDPDRSCQATAAFLGEVKARTIDGTFTSPATMARVSCRGGGGSPNSRRLHDERRRCGLAAGLSIERRLTMIASPGELVLLGLAAGLL
jgi:hypothetical protein